MFFKKSAEGKVAELEARIKALEEENQRLRTALEFYADKDNWTGSHKYRDLDDATIFTEAGTNSIEVDQGAKAARALKGE